MRAECEAKPRCGARLQVPSAEVADRRFVAQQQVRLRGLESQEPIDVAQVTAVRASIQRVRPSVRAEPRVIGYLDHGGLLSWALTFFGLLLLWRRRVERGFCVPRREQGAQIVRVFAVYLVFTSFNVLRTVMQIGRREVIYVHWDISPACFLVQEALVLAQVALIVGVACALQEPEPTAIGQSLRKRGENLRGVLKTWVLDSLCLASSIVPTMVLSWHEILKMGDRRYIGSAVVMHALWAWVWVRVTLPLWTAVRSWDEARIAALEVAMDREKAGEAGAIERADRLAKELDPFSQPTRVVVAAVSVVSFLSPLLAKLVP